MPDPSEVSISHCIIFQYLCDTALPDSCKVFQQGQSVVAKVIEVDADKQRFLLSLRMSDSYQGNVDIGMELLADYLKGYRTIVEKLAKRKGKM